MSDFTDIYKEYLILQYYGKEKATAEMELYASEFENVFNFLNAFLNEFDLDQATGDRLDLIGKIVGQPRFIAGGVPKFFFGFDGNAQSLAYGQGRWRLASDTLADSALMTDGQYKFALKAKIAKNSVSAKVITDDDREGMQTTISRLFDKRAYVVDNLDMTMTLNIDDDYPSDDVDLLVNAGLLPNPMGVEFIINYVPVVP